MKNCVYSVTMYALLSCGSMKYTNKISAKYKMCVLVSIYDVTVKQAKCSRGLSRIWRARVFRMKIRRP